MKNISEQDAQKFIGLISRFVKFVGIGFLVIAVLVIIITILQVAI